MIRLQGEVVRHADEGERFAIRFVNLDRDLRELLRGLIDELSDHGTQSIEDADRISYHLRKRDKLSPDILPIVEAALRRRKRGAAGRRDHGEPRAEDEQTRIPLDNSRKSIGMSSNESEDSRRDSQEGETREVSGTTETTGDSAASDAPKEPDSKVLIGDEVEAVGGEIGQQKAFGDLEHALSEVVGQLPPQDPEMDQKAQRPTRELPPSETTSDSRTAEDTDPSDDGAAATGRTSNDGGTATDTGETTEDTGIAEFGGELQVLFEDVEKVPPQDQETDLEAQRLSTKDWPSIGKAGKDPATEARVRIECYRREAATADGHTAAGLLNEVARLYEEVLNDPRSAMDAFQDALAHDPASPPIQRAALRLASREGDLHQTIELFTMAADAATGSARLGLLLDMAAFQELRLGDGEKAAETYERVLQEDPANMAAAEALLYIQLRQGNWSRVANLCCELAGYEEDPKSRCSLLLAAALSNHGDGDAGARARLAAQALEADPASDLALSLAVALLRKQGDWEEAIRLLEEQAAARPEEEALLLFQASQMLADQLGQVGDAISQAEKAHQSRPTDVVLLDWLAELYRRETRWSELVGVLKKRVELVDVEDERVEIRIRIAEILETRLHQPERAIEELAEALASGADLPTLQILGRLYAQAERWDDLARMHLAEADDCSHPGRHAAALYRLSRVLEEKLDRREEAIAHLEQALDLDDSHAPALRLLQDLYRKEERYGELLVLYQRELKRTEAVDERASLLETIASLLDSRLGEREKAIEAYRKLLDLQPQNQSAMRALMRLFEAKDDHPARLTIMRALANSVESKKQKAELLTRMGQIIEEHLKDPPLALVHYQEAQGHDSTSQDLYRQIGRLLHQVGRWQDLVDLYREQIETAHEPGDRIRLLFRMGWIQEQYLNDLAAARESYQHALSVDIGYWPALRGLRRVAQQVEDLHKVAALETPILEQMASGADKTAALVRIGLMLGEDANDPDHAQQWYAQAVKEDPDNGLARMLLLRSYVERDQWEDVIEMLSPFAAALVAAAGLHSPEKALQLMEKGLEQEPGSLASARWVEALNAARGDRRGQARAIELRGKGESAVNRRAATRFRLAHLAEYDEAIDQDPVPIYREILQDYPSDARVLGALERVAYATDDNELLLEVFQRHGELGPTGRVKALAWANRANLLTRMGREQDAVQDWRRALDVDPLCRPAYEALKLVCSQRNDEETMSWVLELGLDSVSHPETQALDLIRRADLRRQKGNWEGAVADLDRVLAAKPAQPNALERIEQILREQGDFKGFAGRLLQAAKQTSSPRHRAEICLQLGLVYQHELNDLREAERFLSKAIDADPNNVKVLLAAAELRVKLDQPTEALALLNRVVLRASDKEDLCRARLEIARICEAVLGDSIRARESIAAILQQDPNHLDALRQIVRLADPLEDREDLEAGLRKLGELEQDPARRAQYLVSLSRLVRENLGPDAPEAEELQERAIELWPGNANWLQGLVDSYEQRGAWVELERILASQINNLDLEHRPAFMLMHGRVLGVHLDRQDDARDVLRAVIQGDPDNEPALELLLRQIDVDAIEDPALLDEAIELHRFMLSRHPLLVDSLRALRRLCKQAGRIDESYCAESCLVLLGAATEEEEYFHKQNRKRAPTKAAGSLQRDQLELVALPDADHPARRVLAALGPHLTELVPVDFGHYGLENLEWGRLGHQHEAREVTSYCAQILEVERFEVMEAFGGVPRGTSEPGARPTLLLPRSLQRLSVPEQRFLCGRLLTRVALDTESLDPGRSEPLSLRTLEIMLVALQRTDDAAFGEDVAPVAILNDMVQRLRQLLGEDELKAAREAAAEAWAGPGRDHLARWIRSTELGACRGGILCCGSILSGWSALTSTSDDPLAEDLRRDLISFTASKEHAELRRKLGTAIQE